MTYKCIVCGLNEVRKQGGTCELCAIGEDPYAASIRRMRSVASESVPEVTVYDDGDTAKKEKRQTNLMSRVNSARDIDSRNNAIINPPNTSPLPVQRSVGVVRTVSESIPSTVTTQSEVSSLPQPICHGIVRNIMVDTQERRLFSRWVRTLFFGVPYTMDDTATMFQVFPDYTGTSLNAQGTVCDQIIVYGRLATGAVCENNEVEIYGKRDKNNIIVVKRIRNVASGTIIEPQRVVGTGAVWVITAIVLAFIIGLAISLGVTGMVWLLVLLFCLTHLSLVFKILGGIFGVLFTIFFRRRR